MILSRFSEKPSTKILIIDIVIGFVLCFVAIPIMQYYTQLSGYPAQIFSSQLSFSGDLMKLYYSLTNIELYRIAPSLDYVFMMGYGLILFSSSILISRRFGQSSIIQKQGIVVALSGGLAAVCDAIENIFILAMLTDPANFPNYWAITHSVFALIKWILLFLVIFWIIIFGILTLFKRKSK